MSEHSGPWIELGDRVFARRYRFFDQQIGAILADREVLVIDTRSTPAQAREIRDDLRELTADPVSVAVNTHWHFDHSFGNQVFRPAPIWGHVRVAERLRADGPRTATEVAEGLPELAAELDELVIDPPDRSFFEDARLIVGGRQVWLRHLGRGHTDSDIVVDVADAGVLFAGDLLEGRATPGFGDSYPLDWPETVSRLLDLARGPVVPGHGPVGDRAFADEQLAAFLEIARLGREIHSGRMSVEDGISVSPFSPETSREPLERAVAQLRGELD